MSTVSELSGHAYRLGIFPPSDAGTLGCNRDVGCPVFTEMVGFFAQDATSN